MSEWVLWEISGGMAEVYERVFVPAAMNIWAHKAVDLLAPRQGYRILDAACGTGAVALAFARRLGKDCQIVGYDLNPDMLAVARTKGADTDIDWQIGDISRLPFQDHTFDIVTCHFGLMFFPDRAGALKEMVRVLAPGGQVFALVWGAIERNPGFHAVAEGFGRYIDAEARESIRGSFVLGDPEQMRALTAAAGFSDAHVHTIQVQAQFPSVESIVQGYGALLQAVIDRATYSRLMEAVIGDLKPYSEGGALCFPMEAIALSITK